MDRDLARQLVVVVSAVLGIAGAFVGSGAVGGEPVEQASGGALAADATRIAPGEGAFSIWTVIYLGLVAYAIWQLLPAQRTDPRQRRLGYPVAASLLLNAAWILSVQFSLLVLSVPIIVGILAVLVWAFRILLRTEPKNLVESVVADGTVGLYLGWVCVATAANITAVLLDQGFGGFGINPDIWAIAVVVVAGLVGLWVALRGRGRVAPMLSLCWGLAWVAVARLTGNLLSTPTAVAAIAAVVVVVVATGLLRFRAETVAAG